MLRLRIVVAHSVPGVTTISTTMGQIYTTSLRLETSLSHTGLIDRSTVPLRVRVIARVLGLRLFDASRDSCISRSLGQGHRSESSDGKPKQQGGDELGCIIHD
jgi:hypothetical protein